MRRGWRDHVTGYQGRFPLGERGRYKWYSSRGRHGLGRRQARLCRKTERMTCELPRVEEAMLMGQSNAMAASLADKQLTRSGVQYAVQSETRDSMRKRTIELQLKAENRSFWSG